jgi:hypothetical protein
MFALTCYGWLLFRSESWSQAAGLTGRLLTGGDAAWTVGADVGVPVLLYAGPLVLLQLAEATRGDLCAIPRLPTVVRYSVYAALIYMLVLFGDFRASEFIYVQF